MIRTQQANVARLWGNGAKMSKLGGQGGQVGHVEEVVDFRGFG